MAEARIRLVHNGRRMHGEVEEWLVAQLAEHAEQHHAVGDHRHELWTDGRAEVVIELVERSVETRNGATASEELEGIEDLLNGLGVSRNPHKESVNGATILGVSSSSL